MQMYACYAVQLNFLKLGTFQIFTFIQSAFIRVGKMFAQIFSFSDYFFQRFIFIRPHSLFVVALQITAPQSRVYHLQLLYSIQSILLCIYIPFECCATDSIIVSDLALTSLVLVPPEPLLCKRSPGGLGTPFSASLWSSTSGNLGF